MKVSRINIITAIGIFTAMATVGCMKAQAQSTQQSESQNQYQESNQERTQAQNSGDVSSLSVQPDGFTTSSVKVDEKVGSDAAPCGPASYSVNLYDVCILVNQERAHRGLPAVKFDSRLSRVAQKFAVDMVIHNYFSHESPSGGTMHSRMVAEGVPFGWAGENIAKGHRDAQEVMQGWMNSPGHRSNILHPKYRKIGIGLDNRTWVQEFSD
jgi:uncharacterized protein YkwD